MNHLLFLINKRAGSGYTGGKLDALREKATLLFSRDFRFEFYAAEAHPEIEQVIGGFMTRGAGNGSIIIAGGGGGTLSAVINGVCKSGGDTELPGPGRLKIASLRMGSGNVLARHLGAPTDPFAGLDAIRASIDKGSFLSCCIGRYRFTGETGKPDTRYAATLAGFGLFGRVPGMLSRFHKQSRVAYPAMVRTFGIEKTTSLEYAGALVIGVLRSLIRPGNLANSEIITNDRSPLKTKLLAGAVLNFRVPSLPFSPDCRIQDDFLQLFLLPCKSRMDMLKYLLLPVSLRRKAEKMSVKMGQVIIINLDPGKYDEFFLDEDTHFFTNSMEISAAGFISFFLLS